MCCTLPVVDNKKLTMCCTLPVVDKWGYLWASSGAFLYKGTDATTYSVLRFDTANTGNSIRVFKMTHETNVRIGYWSSTHFCYMPALSALPLFDVTSRKADAPALACAADDRSRL